MREFLSGAVVAGSVVASLFFLRFWRSTRDRLFAFFAAAFVLMAVNQTALAFLPGEDEARTLFYGLRFVAFALILVAVVDKNRTKG